MTTNTTTVVPSTKPSNKLPASPNSPVQHKIDDIYNLAEWQNHTDLFGESVFGILNSNPHEMNTIQQLLNIYKQSSGQSNQSTQLTTQVGLCLKIYSD